VVIERDEWGRPVRKPRPRFCVDCDKRLDPLSLYAWRLHVRGHRAAEVAAIPEGP
jgi:hypothetical protein